MSTLLLAGSFVALWIGVSLLLSCVPRFRRRAPLVDRLRPYARYGTDWVDDVERWVNEQ